MNDEDKTMIEEAERLDVEATPGPWFVEENRGGVGRSSQDYAGYPPSEGHLATTSDGEYCENPKSDDDAEFIASSRTLLPRLAARLRAVLEELNDAKNERDAALGVKLINVLGHLTLEQRRELYRLGAEVDEVSGGPEADEEVR